MVVVQGVCTIVSRQQECNVTVIMNYAWIPHVCMCKAYMQWLCQLAPIIVMLICYSMYVCKQGEDVWLN